MPAENFDTYADQLKDLLTGAEAAIHGGVASKLKTARDSFVDFVESSNDLIPGVIELDNVASAARRDVVLALLSGSLETNIGERTGEVAALVKKFSNQSATNSSIASDLKLERVRSLTDASIVMVNELHKLADMADASTSDGKQLAKAIQDAIDAISKVKDKATA